MSGGVEEGFRRDLLENPEDDSLPLIFADWLQERCDPRAELLLLLRRLTAAVDVPQRPEQERRLHELLAAGLRWPLPQAVNDLGMCFAWIPPGTFRMGSPPEEASRDDDEVQHRVTLTRGFHLGVHTVTQAQWRAVMGDNPSNFPGEDCPVESVTAADCREFLRRLGLRDGRAYRLPTEAEWEHACRGGTTTPFWFGAGITPDLANYDGNYAYEEGPVGAYRQRTVPVGSFPANPWGLHEMHGNVYELCGDWYAPYAAGAALDPSGPESGTSYATRGGSWFIYPWNCRSANRNFIGHNDRDNGTGLRVCFTPARR
jgi:uncharacterized protein (TIGR02996 family)